MDNMKRIPLLVTALFLLMAAPCANAMWRGGSGSTGGSSAAPAGAARRAQMEDHLEEFSASLLRSAAGFYSGLAQVGVEGLREAAKAETEIRVKQATARAEALKFGVATREVMKSLTNGRNLAKVSGAVVGGAAGVAATYFAAKLAFNYLDALIGKPTLVRETSIRSRKDQMLDILLGRKPAPSRFDEIILDADLEFKLKEIADTLEMGIEDGEGVRHVLLTGPAGTGKTMFAKALAMRLSQKNLRRNGKRVPVHYVCCAGADFAQFKAGDDIAEIHKVIDFAMKSEGITVLFVDEVDSLLKDRLDSLVSEASINRTNTLLSIFDKPTHPKIMLIGATNFEHKIDKAAFSRFSKKIAFGMPRGETLGKLFDQYLKKEVLSKGITCDETFDAHREELIQSLYGLSPRTIEDVASQMYTRVRFMRTKVLTYEIAKGLIAEAHAAEKRNKAEIAASA